MLLAVVSGVALGLGVDVASAAGENSRRVALLSKELQSGDCHRQKIAAYELGTMGPAAASATPALVQLIRRTLAGDCFADCGAAEARDSLAAIGSGAVPVLIEQLGTGEECGLLPEALALIGEPAVKHLAAILSDERQRPDRRADAAAAIGGMAARRESSRAAVAALPALLIALKSRDGAILQPTMFALVQMGPSGSEAVLSLITVLDHSDEGIAGYAAYALAAVGDPTGRAVQALRRRLTQPRGPGFRVSAEMALKTLLKPKSP